MIVPSESARLIVRGRKTVMRCPMKRGERRPRLRPGKSYAVQPGIGQRQVARIAIQDIEPGRLGDLTFADVRAEGYRTTDEFKTFWVCHYDKAWVRQQELMIAEALKQTDALGTDASEAMTDAFNENLKVAFDARHADTDVWVIRFEPDRSHRPRLLAPTARGVHDGDEHGYTDNPRRALPDEPEAVDEHVLDEYAADALTRHAGLPGRREEHLKRRARSLATRVRQEALEAFRNGLDPTSELDQIEQHLRLLKNRRRAESA